MKVMPSVLGQVGQNVADNLFEIGQSAVKATADAAVGIVGETIEQVMTAPGQATAQRDQTMAENKNRQKEERKAANNRRYEEVKGELANYLQRKRQLDQKIAEEKAAEKQQTNREDTINKQKRDNWVSRLINRSQTGTERGKLSE